MSKIWMMSSVASIAAVAAMAWGAQPARSSQDWLAKAQSEFATKARDAVIQRRLSQESGAVPPAAAQTAPSIVATDQSPAEQHSVAGAQPTTVRPVSVGKDAAPAERDASVAAVLASAPIETVPPSLPVKPAAEEPVQASTVVAAAQRMQERDEPKPTEPASKQPPQPVVPNLAPLAPTPIAATPTAKVTPPARHEAPQKTRGGSKQAVSAHASRRSGHAMSMEERGLQALRQHAPDIAAMVARYM